jgi:hypothetical protein
VSAGVPAAPRARYLPITQHGLIGDLHTVALVGTDGTFDRYCCPRLDWPSVFAATTTEPSEIEQPCDHSLAPPRKTRGVLG